MDQKTVNIWSYKHMELFFCVPPKNPIHPNTPCFWGPGHPSIQKNYHSFKKLDSFKQPACRDATDSMFHPLRCTDSLDRCGWSSMQEMWAQDRCGAIGTFHMNSGNNKLFCLCGRKWCFSWPTVACHITMYLNIYTYMCNYIYYLFIFPYIGIWYISHPTFSRWLKRVVCRCILRLSTSVWILFLKWCFARARHFSIVHTVHVERIILVFLDDMFWRRLLMDDCLDRTPIRNMSRKGRRNGRFPTPPDRVQ